MEVSIAPTRRLSNADIQNELRQHKDLRPGTWSTAGLDNERGIYEDEIYMLRGIVKLGSVCFACMNVELVA